MITDEEYLQAVKIVKEYHQQINSIVEEVIQIDKRTSKKVKCIREYSSGGFFMDYLTIGKEYEIIHKPYTRNGRNKDYNNDEYFAIIDNNGKKRYYVYDYNNKYHNSYKNPNDIFEFINI